MLPRDLEEKAAFVGLAYLKLAYKTFPRDKHYLDAKRRMHKHIVHAVGRIPKKNPYMKLITSSSKYLKHNMPHMQVLLNVSIDRTRHSKRMVLKALNSLKI